MSFRITIQYLAAKKKIHIQKTNNYFRFDNAASTDYKITQTTLAVSLTKSVPSLTHHENSDIVITAFPIRISANTEGNIIATDKSGLHGHDSLTTTQNSDHS